MSDYKNEGNRWTAIYVREPRAGGKYVYVKAPFEIVRFNVDSDPDAPEEIVPEATQRAGGTNNKADGNKFYEKIWVVEVVPFSASRDGKHDFGSLADEYNTDPS